MALWGSLYDSSSCTGERPLSGIQASTHEGQSMYVVYMKIDLETNQLIPLSIMNSILGQTKFGTSNFLHNGFSGIRGIANETLYFQLLNTYNQIKVHVNNGQIHEIQFLLHQKLIMQVSL